MQRIAMLCIQNDRSPRGGYFGAVNGKNNTTAVVLFMPQGLQLFSSPITGAVHLRLKLFLRVMTTQNPGLSTHDSGLGLQTDNLRRVTVQ